MKINGIIQAALEEAGGYGDDERKAIANHLADGLDAHIAFFRFLLAPEAYEAREIDEIITRYVSEVSPRLTAIQSLQATRTVVHVENIADRLIAGEKLKPEERKSIKKSGIAVEDLIHSIQTILSREGFYPPQAIVWTPGEEVFDGAFLEWMKDGRCRFHFQKARELDAFILEEGRCVMMDKAEEAVTRYIQWRWKEGIDGIPIKY